jgi:hypothetical protein
VDGLEPGWLSSPRRSASPTCNAFLLAGIIAVVTVTAA